jgi:branched-chain amino acid transport system permease protein
MEVFLRTLLLGLVTGSVYGLAATGVVLTYRTSGILNLGYGALAMFTTFVYWNFVVTLGWPLWAAVLVVVVAIAPAIGFFLDSQLFRRIEGQPTVIGVIATVGLSVLLQGIVFVIWGSDAVTVPSLFSKRPVPIVGGATLGVDQLAILGISVGAVVGLGLLLRYTRIGVAFRAVVDNRAVAGLMAVNTGLISGLAWALATSFAALTGILLAPRLFLDPVTLPFFVIAFLLGAAILGYLRSLPLAFVGGVLIGVIQAVLVQYGTFRGVIGNVGNATPFLIVTLMLLLAPRRLRREVATGSFIVRTREVAGQAPRAARVGVAAVTLGLLALFPALVGSGSWRSAMTTGLLQAIVFLSLVILTGFSGQISLGHTAFMGIAAYTAAHLMADLDWSGWAALAAGVAAAVPAGALLGIVAVRLHGLYLALMTLAFAFMAQDLFFVEPFVSGREGSIPVPRPEGAQGEVSFYYLALAALALVMLVAANLRSGRTGRVLAALRDSETGSRSLGIDPLKYKVLIFSLSAVIAAVGGTLLVMQKGTVARLDFIPFLSIVYVTVAVVGGIFHIGGGLAAGLLFGLFNQAFRNHPAILESQLILFGLGATLALAQNPEGMFGEMRRGAAAVLRVLGRRRPVAEPAPVTGAQR